MRADIAHLDVKGRRRSLLGYTLGMAVYVLVVVAIYPAFEHSNSLDKLIQNDAAAAALFGVSGKISTSSGWLNANIYANFFPLVMLLLTIGYGASSLAGQNEDGTLCLLATLPVGRSSIVRQKVAAMVTQAAVLAVVVAAVVLIGQSFDLRVSLGRVAFVSLAVLLMGLDFGLISMAIGALRGRKGTALGMASALAGASYLVSSLAPVASWIRPARYASLFYWSVGNNQLGTGISLDDFAVLVAVGVSAFSAALVAFRRLDVR
jgi:ABC-2 type transport system permease protein